MIVLAEPEATIPHVEKSVLDYRQVTDNNGDFEAPSVTWADPFVIMFTSGTTGPSKGSLMPQNYALFMGKVCMETAEYTEEDCLYNTLPLFHGNAQLLSTMRALMSGARMVLAETVFRQPVLAGGEKIRLHRVQLHRRDSPYSAQGGTENRTMRTTPCGLCSVADVPPHLFDEVETRFGVTLLGRGTA